MGFKTDGVFRTQEKCEYKSSKCSNLESGVGRIKYVDANGDGDINTNDRVWLGSDNQKK